MFFETFKKFKSIFGKSRDKEFYQYFTQHAENSVLAALALQELLKDIEKNQSKIQDIIELEHENDRISKKVYDLLNSVFITHLDKNDICTIIKALDDVTDNIKDVADLVGILIHIDSNVLVRKEAQEFCDIICEACKEMAVAVKQIDVLNLDKVAPNLDRINEIENRGDDLKLRALKCLFTNPPQESCKENLSASDLTRRILSAVALMMIWNKFFERAEKVTDCLEDVADCISTIAHKS